MIVPYYETPEDATPDAHRVLRGGLPAWPRRFDVPLHIADPPFHLMLATYEVDTGPPILERPGTAEAWAALGLRRTGRGWIWHEVIAYYPHMLRERSRFLTYDAQMFPRGEWSFWWLCGTSLPEVAHPDASVLESFELGGFYATVDLPGDPDAPRRGMINATTSSKVIFSE